MGIRYSNPGHPRFVILIRGKKEIIHDENPTSPTIEHALSKIVAQPGDVVRYNTMAGGIHSGYMYYDGNKWSPESRFSVSNLLP